MKYAIIINELKFGTITQPNKKLYDTEEDAQKDVEQFANDYIMAIQKFYPDKKYNYQKKSCRISGITFYHNEILENGELAFDINILSFEI